MFMQIYTYAFIYARREAMDLVLGNRNEEWTISSQLIGFAFPFSLLHFCSSKTISPLALIPPVVTACRQCSGLMLQPVFEHSAMSICCVLFVPMALYPVVSVCPQPGLVCSCLRAGYKGFEILCLLLALAGESKYSHCFLAILLLRLC